MIISTTNIGLRPRRSASPPKKDKNAEQGRGANNAARRWPDFEFIKEQRKSDAANEKNEAGEEFARRGQRPTEQSSVDPHRQFVDVVLHRLRARLGGQQSLPYRAWRQFPLPTDSHEAIFARSLFPSRRPFRCRALPFIFISERVAPFTVFGLGKLVARTGIAAQIGFPVHPHMLCDAAGFVLVNKGTDTRTLRAYLGHRSIQSTVRYTESAPNRFKNLWR
jgi:Phage integrase family